MTEIGNEPADAGLDDAALFAQATANDAPTEIADNPAIETAAPIPPAAEPAVPPQGQQPGAPREDHRVPLHELKAERDKRQAYERQLAETQARLAAMEQQFRVLQQPQSPPPAAPDIFEDPAGFVSHQLQSHLSPRDAAAMENARLIAEARFGEKDVAEAENAVMTAYYAGRMHPADVARIQNSPNRFAEAVRWHQRERVLTDTGGDLSKYREKVRQEALSDPEFRKVAMTTWQTQAAPGSQPARPISLPPSISKVGSAATVSDDEASLSDEQLWARTIGRK